MRRLVGLILLIAYTFSLGCSSVQQVPLSKNLDSEERVLAVVYPDGKVVKFDDKGGVINSYRGTIDGYDRHGQPLSIKIDDSLQVRMVKTDAKKTAISFLAVAAVVAIIAAVIHHNQPYDVF